MGKFIDLTDRTFGKLTVLERAENGRHGNVRWLCQCNCVDKNRVITRSHQLKSGRTRSCGCTRESSFDLTDQTFGRLTVLERAENSRQGKTRWLCQCNCVDKNRVIVSGKNLRHGDTRSCGCYCSEKRSETGYKHGMSRTVEYRMWLSAKSRAAKRGMDFNITVADIRIPVKCPILNIPIIKGAGKRRADKLSLDRVDNTKGYTKDNIAVISWKANILKADLSIDQTKALLAYMTGELPLTTEYQPTSIPTLKTTATI